VSNILRTEFRSPITLQAANKDTIRGRSKLNPADGNKASRRTLKTLANRKPAIFYLGAVRIVTV
jgi:hypothetical protein